MDSGEPLIDSTRPNIARVYDALNGGRENFEADRKPAGRLVELYPPLLAVLQSGRAFTRRVVTWAAGQGIGQFIDLGSGMPSSSPVHVTARQVIPDARAAYVDSDLLVASHTRVLLGGKGGIAVVRADLTDPAAVLDHGELRRVISLDRPLCLLATLVLNFVDAAAAQTVMAGYAERLAPGSVIAVSVITCDDPELLESVRAACAAARLYNHSRADAESFLGGLEPVTPGVVVARAWRAGMPDPGLRPEGSVYVLAGAGRKV